MVGMLFSCRNKIEDINAISGDMNIPVQTTYKGKYQFTENGRLKNTLAAEKLERFIGENPRIEITGGCQIQIFDSLNQVEAILSSEQSVFFEDKHQIIATGNVIFKNNKNEELQTEELIWLQDSNKVYTNKLVKVITEEGTIYGQSLITDEKFSYYKLKGITGTLEVEEPIDINNYEAPQ